VGAEFIGDIIDGGEGENKGENEGGRRSVMLGTKGEREGKGEGT